MFDPSNLGGVYIGHTKGQASEGILHCPLSWPLNDTFPTPALAISEAEKPLEEQQQNNDGWEITVPRLNHQPKVWEGLFNNNEDDPLHLEWFQPLHEFFLCSYDD